MDERWNGSERRIRNQEINHEDRRRGEHTFYDNQQIEEKSPAISLKTIGIVLGIIASIGTLIGGLIAVDDRYITVDENKAIIEKLKQDLTISQKEITKSGKRLFIMMYEDQLDDIDFKIQNGTSTEFERSKKQRIERRIDAIRRDEF